MTVWLLILSILVMAGSAYASDAVCGNAARPACADTVGMTAYHRSIEPGTPLGPLCTELPHKPPSITSDQRQLVQRVMNSHEYGPCHLKVEGGRAAEMTTAEKNAVNSAMDAAKTAQAEIVAEANDPQCSRATVAQIDNFFNNQWDNPANTNDFLGDINGLTTNTAAAIRTTLTAITQRQLTILRKMAKCNRAMGG